MVFSFHPVWHPHRHSTTTTTTTLSLTESGGGATSESAAHIFILMGVFLGGLLCLLSLHTYLLASGQSTIELYANCRRWRDGQPQRRPFDRGWRANVAARLCGADGD